MSPAQSGHGGMLNCYLRLDHNNNNNNNNIILHTTKLTRCIQ